MESAAVQLAELNARVAKLRHHLQAGNQRDALDILDGIGTHDDCTKCLIMDEWLSHHTHPHVDLPRNVQNPQELAS